MARVAEIRTTCPYCGVGCGVRVKPVHEAQSVHGDERHPANFGRLCSKGAALGETLTLEERLLHPMADGARVSWDAALTRVADGFRNAIDQHGPDAVALYVSGQLLTEDYYVANKLMKGFVGSANIDTNSRLCMASSVAGHKRAFGADTVPGVYEDLELADLVVLVGSNFAWCHPVLHQRLMAARRKSGARLVVIDPRATATTADADLHLPIKPGTDVTLFNALFDQLAQSSARDERYIEDHTEGLEAALSAVGSASLEDVAASTGLSPSDLRTFIDWVRETPKTVTVYSQGVNQSSAGTDKVNAIINTHLVTGRIGRPGAGPFSITGQPNAMGGREVGGLANQLACHMDFDPTDVDRVRRFWNAPRMAERPGKKAVDLFQAIGRGEIKAVWIMATNPVVSMPDADAVREALQACPLVVVSDIVATSDTVQLADIALPATGWGEKTGTVTNSERRISRQRAFLPSPGEARHDWAIVADAARRMGHAGFDYQGPAEIFREYAALSAFENDGARDFDIGAWATCSDADYDAMSPFQWPARKSGPVAPSSPRQDTRFFANGGFFTPSRKGRFVATPARAPARESDEEYDLVLNTGRIRDQWHTMTRTAKTARLSAHIAEPFLEMNPMDASARGLADADIVTVRSRLGEATLRLLVTDAAPMGRVFAPMHWASRYASCGRVDVLAEAVTDPISGQPELKHTPVCIRRSDVDWYAFGVFTEEPAKGELSSLGYWAKARTKNGWRTEFAGKGEAPLQQLTAALFKGKTRSGVQELRDRAGFRRARYEGDVLNAFLTVNRREPVAADRSWLSSLVGVEIDAATRAVLLAGRPPTGAAAGRIVCACEGVGVDAIRNAISCGATSVDEIGRTTRAGTNCGSCRSEIAALIERAPTAPNLRAAE